MRQPSFRVSMLIYSALVIFMVILAVALWQLHATLLVISLAIINNPDLRPPSWSTNTLSAIARLLGFILGSIWLCMLPFAEHHFRTSRTTTILRQRAIWLFGIVIAVYLISFLSILLF